MTSVAELISTRQLDAVFQPVLAFGEGRFVGYEGLIRGPSRTKLAMPRALIDAAKTESMAFSLEVAARETIVSKFQSLALPGTLFVNVTPDMLTVEARKGSTFRGLAGLHALTPDRVVLELADGARHLENKSMMEAIARLRAQGFRIAIDDLGDRFSRADLWTKLKPEYVKIDHQWLHGAQSDPFRQSVVKSIHALAASCGTRVIAKGVENEAQLRLVMDLGVEFAQGYLIERPSLRPPLKPAAVVQDLVDRSIVPVYPELIQAANRGATAAKLLRPVPPLQASATNEDVFARFDQDAELQNIAVVDGEIPVGMINRISFFDRFARPFQREVFGRRPCTAFMDPAALVVESNTSLQALSLKVASQPRYLTEGFILTEAGRYAGLGTGHDLMREITQLQIAAARYSNPLTLLPGNVPLAEHMDRLMNSDQAFAACYADLDHFKPLNDVFGYRKGDEVIVLVGRILSQVCHPEHDFLGHIGGDDFMMLMQSEDWEQRCADALRLFGERVPELLDPETRAQRGFYGEDRRGQRHFFPLPSLSLGVVLIPAGAQFSPVEISTAAADAKKQAKRIEGDSLFIERRRIGA